MRRINPQTNEPFKYGDVREDGYIFKEYKLKRLKKNGYFAEGWLSPESFEKQKAINANWYKNNVEKHKARAAKWQKNNPDKVNAITAKRRSAKLKRTPPWLNDNHLLQIQAFYSEAKQLSDQTGVLHHVDHIVPLQGKTVSGLHVPWNLQILTASENSSKHNRYAEA